MLVYKAINNITLDLSKIGIEKNRRNQQQGYSFRGIDDVYQALSSLLARHNLCILPRVISREVNERATAKGGSLFYVTVCVEFDFVSSEDQSKHTVVMYGEAMDSADKATNKAMSAAYKYCCLQAFCIPTEGDNDADATTHEVVASSMDSYMETVQSITDIEKLRQYCATVKEEVSKAYGIGGWLKLQAAAKAHAGKIKEAA
jgi:hypothetical protein